jgi:hypothetical protein
MRQEFLDLYADRLTTSSTLFPGMADVLTAMEAQGLRGGVVTNKPARRTVSTSVTPSVTSTLPRRPAYPPWWPCTDTSPRRIAPASGVLGVTSTIRWICSGIWISILDTHDGHELFPQPVIIRIPWGRPGFDVGCKADKGIPRTSYLVNQLESNSRQRRNLRSGRLRARLLTGSPAGRAGLPAEESCTRDRAAPGHLVQR